jgi:MFS superfamily sulfate permease-like transporter
MIALLEAYRAGLLVRNQWLSNVIAGVVVGVVALPLAMAFAIASGARPEQGLYTAIIGGACVSVFGGSRLQIASPASHCESLRDALLRAGVGRAGLIPAEWLVRNPPRRMG